MQGPKLSKNKMCFTDDFFKSCEYLQRKYTSQDHLAIKAGSNEWLLVGLQHDKRPDLMK